MADLWLNENSGIEARNATTQHTVAFGFTSASDSLLIFIAGGAVTHDDNDGTWTERLAPVQHAELAVFTKVSTGDSQIVIDHNASDYPMPWQVFEYPEDSTYLDGASDSAADTTWPTLSGLTSNEKTIIAAICRASAETTGTATAGSWTVTTNEISDQIIVNDGSTDGAFLAVAYEERVTATSVAPTTTVTIPGDDPFNSGAECQQVVFAIDVVSAAAVYPPFPRRQNTLVRM